jgi:hypothetical protein
LKAHLKFVNHTALLALALCFFAGLGKAQNTCEGKFTLPFETHWRGAVLPAGDYTVSIPSESTPYLLYVRGEGKTAIIMANGTDTKMLSDHSQLTIMNSGGKQTITQLEAGQLGLAFDYSLPKMNKKLEAHSHPSVHSVPASTAGS